MDRSARTTILFAVFAAVVSEREWRIADAHSISCPLNDTYKLTKAFIGLQRIRTGTSFPDGFRALFHCEPVGLTNGDPVDITCKKGVWTRSGTNTAVSMPICTRAGVDDVLINIHGDFVVGPSGVTFTKPRTVLNLTCEVQTSLRQNNTSWKLKSYITSKPRTKMVRIIDGSKVTVSLHTSEVVEFECRVSHRSRKITIRAGDHHFCTEPVLHPGLRVLERSGPNIRFTCAEGTKSYGQLSITCLKTGQWDHSPPSCLSTEAKTTPRDETDVVTCSVFELHEQVALGVVIDATQERVSSGSVFDAKCDSPGFVPVGDSGSITCQQDGTWNFANNLKCVRGCYNFNVTDDSLIIEGWKSTYDLGDSITLACREGKHLVPHVERILCFDDTWLPNTLPKCVADETDGDKKGGVTAGTSGRKRSG